MRAWMVSYHRGTAVRHPNVKRNVTLRHGSLPLDGKYTNQFHLSEDEFK